jgi:hypothetical protein
MYPAFCYPQFLEKCPSSKPNGKKRNQFDEFQFHSTKTWREKKKVNSSHRIEAKYNFGLSLFHSLQFCPFQEKKIYIERKKNQEGPFAINSITNDIQAYARGGMEVEGKPTESSSIVVSFFIRFAMFENEMGTRERGGWETRVMHIEKEIRMRSRPFWGTFPPLFAPTPRTFCCISSGFFFSVNFPILRHDETLCVLFFLLLRSLIAGESDQDWEGSKEYCKEKFQWKIMKNC